MNPPANAYRPMRYAVWILVAALIVLHHDFWFWDDGRLVLGFLPVGLLYQMGISLAAAAIWLLAAIFAWPLDEEDEAAAADEEGPGGAGA